jgi:Ca-activated chloride channel family protein
MKNLYLLLVFMLLFAKLSFANGVTIVNASTPTYFYLDSTNQAITVYDQVAEVVTTQYFRNLTGADTPIKFAFPLHDEASATSLRWKVNNIWYSAVFAPSPQDTTMPGGNDPYPDLVSYLGDSPLYFSIPGQILADSTIIIELTYVELLPYSFSTVQFHYPNDYSLIQDTYINHQHMHFILESQRSIESISFEDFPNAIITIDENHAEITNDIYESPATQDYLIDYTLNADQLGLFGYSNFLPDSLNTCDEYGNGFFTFIVEPNPNDTTNVIQKVFTFIIDQSGSMSGTKINQAKAAASYIVNNLNEGDLFNIVSFSTEVYSFMPDHVAFTETTRTQALNYINNISALNLTNISGAFHTAIEDYTGNDTTQANIIIFLTDGLPTAGLTGTEEILDYIQSQQSYYEVNNLMINTFGIGSDVNMSLLSQIASQNNGLCEFLLNNELEAMITDFYRRIRNPVLLDINMTFDPPIVTETYPNPLPNLYLGQQLIVSGRYDVADSVNITLSGQAFGITKTYQYGLNLTDTLNYNKMFLTKLWAKRKIENLYVQYFTYPEGSAEAEEIKAEIIQISMCYNVSSEFTHFEGGDPVGTEEMADNETVNNKNLTVYPNPFVSEISFSFDLGQITHTEYVFFEIYDMYGRLIYSETRKVDQSGNFEIVWNGCNQDGISVPQGLYSYRITSDSKQFSGQILKALSSK